eukprot:scaffold5631_cov117-Cylindrotheca_fusiformis.AAC.3
MALNEHTGTDKLWYTSSRVGTVELQDFKEAIQSPWACTLPVPVAHETSLNGIPSPTPWCVFSIRSIMDLLAAVSAEAKISMELDESPAKPVPEATPEPAAESRIEKPFRSSTSMEAFDSWRVRDMAVTLFSKRPRNDKRDAAMPVSNQFDAETSLARIRRDKSGVVQKAFEAAASTVISSLEGSEEDTPDHESVNEEDLPGVVLDTKSLEALRAASLERAHDNKDASKRKLARKQELPLTTKAATSSKAKKGPGVKKSDTPKFTRNTPASSAAALDARLTGSRAILCTAANVTFEALTPPLPGLDVDMADIPQNPSKSTADESTTSGTVNNMGAVVVEAQTLGQRIEAIAENAAQRSSSRYRYRKDIAMSDKPRQSHFQIKNPFAWNENASDDEDDDDDIMATTHEYNPSDEAITDAWEDLCLPRLLSILHTGVGHAIYHDVNWSSRHGRIANLLQTLSEKDGNYGPHLIVTVEPDVDRFSQEFRPVNSHLRLLSMVDTECTRCLRYTGSSAQRAKLRKQFPDASGLPEAPFHVIVTSYADFLKDYLHFCQLPFEVVIMDDGVSWMAAAQSDQNSPMGRVWDEAIWSKNDHQMGLAGAVEKDWDFSADTLDETTIKEAWVGLTARHRVATASTLKVQQRSSSDTLPVSGIVNFVAPHFAEAVREEWDRSRITADSASMKHFRNLVTRSMVVHDSTDDRRDALKLALDALKGKLTSPTRSDDPNVPELIPDESFVSDGKVAFSRRGALLWLGSTEESWLRYELGVVKFQHILDAMKASASHGHLCEEIVTASSMTSSGATGQVSGTMAYRLATRCGRHFGSEQGLRQHHSALHAPPGTWLCRTCGSDCVTSQARTHHERSCGQPSGGPGNENGNGESATSLGAPNKGGRQNVGVAGTVGKKKGTKGPQAGAGTDQKDPDGSIRLPGYRGVWINQAGKHFVKIDSERLADQDKATIYFDSVDEAARKHDSALKERKPAGKHEFNFKADGSRIVYEDVTTSSTTGIGGSASSVVPALSVINIKDLPPGVKPLLRDPRQTSRTGGNSKRHVYAYRGVCRQARKGHDRWQSQISFMGDLKNFVAWAHLILYGEEATKQAQKEGEEAAAAYEQEKKDIAEGKLPSSQAKAENKKRKPGKKKDEGKDGDEGGSTDKPSKKKRVTKEDASFDKKKRGTASDKESIQPTLAKSVGKAAVLAPRTKYSKISDIELSTEVSTRLLAARERQYCVSEPRVPAPLEASLGSCCPVIPGSPVAGSAMLYGLSPVSFGWKVKPYVIRCYDEADPRFSKALLTLNSQYGEMGLNDTFRTLVHGATVLIGCASDRTQRVHESLGLGTAPTGGVVGTLDCHIGGDAKCCGESAACIRYYPTDSGDFQFSAISANDMVTLNGQRITSEMGSFPLFNEDVCTVGPRVFTFLLPTDT